MSRSKIVAVVTMAFVVAMGVRKMLRSSHQTIDNLPLDNGNLPLDIGKFPPQTDSFFFIESSGTDKILPRVACAIESAAKVSLVIRLTRQYVKKLYESKSVILFTDVLLRFVLYSLRENYVLSFFRLKIRNYESEALKTLKKGKFSALKLGD